MNHNPNVFFSPNPPSHVFACLEEKVDLEKKSTQHIWRIVHKKCFSPYVILRVCFSGECVKYLNGLHWTLEILRRHWSRSIYIYTDIPYPTSNNWNCLHAMGYCWKSLFDLCLASWNLHFRVKPWLWTWSVKHCSPWHGKHS